MDFFGRLNIIELKTYKPDLQNVILRASENKR